MRLTPAMRSAMVAALDTYGNTVTGHARTIRALTDRGLVQPANDGHRLTVDGWEAARRLMRPAVQAVTATDMPTPTVTTPVTAPARTYRCEWSDDAGRTWYPCAIGLTDADVAREGGDSLAGQHQRRFILAA